MTGFAWWFRLRGSRCYFRAASARRSYQIGAGVVVAIVFAIGVGAVVVVSGGDHFGYCRSFR